jgi:hypothetical protein
MTRTGPSQLTASGLRLQPGVNKQLGRELPGARFAAASWTLPMKAAALRGL